MGLRPSLHATASGGFGRRSLLLGTAASCAVEALGTWPAGGGGPRNAAARAAALGIPAPLAARLAAEAGPPTSAAAGCTRACCARCSGSRTPVGCRSAWSGRDTRRTCSAPAGRAMTPSGRAYDVWAVDGRPVVDPATPRSPVTDFMRAAAAPGSYNVGGPVRLSGGTRPNQFFSDATHHDHVHVGFAD